MMMAHSLSKRFVQSVVLFVAGILTLTASSCGKAETDSGAGITQKTLEKAGEATKNLTGKTKQMATEAVKTAGDMVGSAKDKAGDVYDAAGNMVKEATEKAGDAYRSAGDMVGKSTGSSGVTAPDAGDLSKAASEKTEGAVTAVGQEAKDALPEAPSFPSN